MSLTIQRPADQALGLDESSSTGENIECGWLEEADRRDRELASGAVEGRPWDEVLAAARDRLS